jgi:Peptidase A4 family
MRRLSGRKALCLAAWLPLAGLLLAYGPAASASAAPAGSWLSLGEHSASVNHGTVSRGTRVEHSARSLAAARAALRLLRIGQPTRLEKLAVGPADLIKGQTDVSSSNWSGFADDNSGGNTYTTVAGTWVEPAVVCRSAEVSLVVFWVGIDGYSSDSVEQDGSLAECYEGSAYYFTWWEMYPSNDVQVVGDTVSPGDTITSSVVRSGTSYTLAVTDTTASVNSFTTTQTCSDCANSSAEWIAEDPTNGAVDELYTLPDFYSWSVTNATVKSGSVSGGISTFPDDQIVMIGFSGRAEAEPGALFSNGEAFVVICVPSPVTSSRVPPAGKHPTGSPTPGRTPPPA